jgi:hypothetical protein
VIADRCRLVKVRDEVGLAVLGVQQENGEDDGAVDRRRGVGGSFGFVQWRVEGCDFRVEMEWVRIVRWTGRLDDDQAAGLMSAQ